MSPFISFFPSLLCPSASRAIGLVVPNRALGHTGIGSNPNILCRVPVHRDVMRRDFLGRRDATILCFDSSCSLEKLSIVPRGIADARHAQHLVECFLVDDQAISTGLLPKDIPKRQVLRPGSAQRKFSIYATISLPLTFSQLTILRRSRRQERPRQEQLPPCRDEVS